MQTAKRSPAKSSKKPAAGSSKATSSAHGNNEGTDPNHDYQPPQGAVPVDLKVDPGEFDWDAVKDDDDLELWVIRVPQGVGLFRTLSPSQTNLLSQLKPKHLQNVKFDPPSSSKTSRIGNMDRKHASYDVWSLGDTPSEHVGGEELKRLSCLLPRKNKGGKLYQGALHALPCNALAEVTSTAPKPIARHIVVTTKPAEATPGEDTVEQEETTYKNPPRPRYPLEVLKHRFVPLGALAPTDTPDVMDVDQPIPTISTQEADAPPKKKRKGDGESKKHKKAKAAA